MYSSVHRPVVLTPRAQSKCIHYLIFLSEWFDADIFPMLNHEAGQCFFQFLSLYSCKTSNGLNGMIKGSRTGAKKGNMPRENRCLQ